MKTIYVISLMLDGTVTVETVAELSHSKYKPDSIKWTYTTDIHRIEVLINRIEGTV